jgi:uroporphyrinogen decarboxylase
VRKAGQGGHIFNLGHGVLVGTPEDNVRFFFETAKQVDQLL